MIEGRDATRAHLIDDEGYAQVKSMCQLPAFEKLNDLHDNVIQSLHRLMMSPNTNDQDTLKYKDAINRMEKASPKALAEQYIKNVEARHAKRA